MFLGGPQFAQIVFLTLVITVLQFYTFALFLYVLLGWVAPGTYSPAAAMLSSLCEPLLADAFRSCDQSQDAGIRGRKAKRFDESGEFLGRTATDLGQQKGYSFLLILLWARCFCRLVHVHHHYKQHLVQQTKIGMHSGL